MAINTLADWRGNGAHARQSILGRPRRNESGREPVREDEDEVQRSPATEHHIQSFFDALQAGDMSEQSHALAKIVDAWRADNNAGGLPVYAHLPLPSAFANELAKVAQSGPDGKSAAQGITAKLEPGARLSVLQQLSVPRQIPPQIPSQIPNRNGFDPLERAPTWAPEQTPRERAGSRPVSPPPPVVERTWQQELDARAQSGGRRNALEEWGESFWSLFGYPISPDEQLRRQKAGELERQGSHPIYFGPRDPLPDDPYKDRVAWPVKPESGSPDVIVKSPWGRRTLPSGDEFHPGVDFRNRKGQPAFSVMNGTILRIERTPGGGGNQVFVLNDDGSIVGFAHTDALDGLQEGDEVYAGQLIGMSDGSGGTPAKPPVPHTHISYYPPGTPVDPRTRKPLQGPNPHDLSVRARTQSDPLDGLRLSRPPRRLTPDGYTGQTPMRVDRS
jgi:murein DD-endopeptidase MepM/ murein hydrolase activator NlpD